MSIIPSPLVLLPRQALINISPAPRTLSESSAILQSLIHSFGPISTFLNPRWVPALRERQRQLVRQQSPPPPPPPSPSPTKSAAQPSPAPPPPPSTTAIFLAIFDHPDSLSQAIEAHGNDTAPLTVQINQHPSSPTNSHKVEADHDDPFDIRGLFSGRQNPPPTTPEPKIFQCTISADSDPSSHQTLIRQSPYYSGFELDRLSHAGFQDLVKQRVPLLEFAAGGYRNPDAFRAAPVQRDWAAAAVASSGSVAGASSSPSSLGIKEQDIGQKIGLMELWRGATADQKGKDADAHTEEGFSIRRLKTMKQGKRTIEQHDR